ncbi:unnamed protein product [Lepidochelys olivacea]
MNTSPGCCERREVPWSHVLTHKHVRPDSTTKSFPAHRFWFSPSPAANNGEIVQDEDGVRRHLSPREHESLIPALVPTTGRVPSWEEVPWVGCLLEHRVAERRW